MVSNNISHALLPQRHKFLLTEMMKRVDGSLFSPETVTLIYSNVWKFLFTLVQNKPAETLNLLQIFRRLSQFVVRVVFWWRTQIYNIFSRRYLRSPWWVTTGAAFWCGPWLSIILRESGEHTHRFRCASQMLDAVVKPVCCCVWSAAASLNTPLFPADPSVTPAERLKAEPRFDYQLYFQKPVSLSAAC